MELIPILRRDLPGHIIIHSLQRNDQREYPGFQFFLDNWTASRRQVSDRMVVYLDVREDLLFEKPQKLFTSSQRVLHIINYIILAIIRLGCSIPHCGWPTCGVPTRRAEET